MPASAAQNAYLQFDLACIKTTHTHFYFDNILRLVGWLVALRPIEHIIGHFKDD